MARFIYLFCVLLFIGGSLQGQVHTIKKSRDVVVMKGKSYYLHTVEAGETLYSICRAYGVDVDLVKELNDKKDNTLSLHEVLKVPYTEPFVQQDGKYYYHKVAKGETLYSVARVFGVKVKRILKENDALTESAPLSIGTVVRLPLNEIDKGALRAGKARAELAAKKDAAVEKPGTVPAKVVAEAVVTTPEAEEKKTEKMTVLGAIGRDVKVKEVPWDQAGKKEDIPIANRPVNVPDERTAPVQLPVMPGDYVKVALLLPLYANDYKTTGDSLAPHPAISSRSEQFLSFYEGMLLAVDSLKNAGYKIDLRVFDTEKSEEKMYAVTEKLNNFNPNLIIGPVFAPVFKIVADNLHNKNIPLVYPLSVRSEDLGKYPNFVQVNTSFNVMAEGMADWVEGQRANANLILLELDKNPSGQIKEFINRMHRVAGMNTFKWTEGGQSDPLKMFRERLLPDRENIVILPTTKEVDVSKILPLLSAYADRYKITVVGFPEWQTFTSVDHETYFKLNVKLFIYNYVDYATRAAKNFGEKYRGYFYTAPNTLASKAFDIGLYFIDLAAKYGDRTLEAIENNEGDGLFSTFRFHKIPGQEGKENVGLYIVNYGSDYQLKINKVNPEHDNGFKF